MKTKSFYYSLLENLSLPYTELDLPDLPKLKKEGGYSARISLYKQGVDLLFDYLQKKWMFRSFQMYPRKEGRFVPFAESIEGKIEIGQDRKEIQKILKKPSRSGGTGQAGTFGIVDDEWDRYDFTEYSLRFDYFADGRLYLVSVMNRELAMELNPDMGKS